jgi:hypothetical protein
MPQTQRWAYRCDRCGHEWVMREIVPEPTLCPECKSLNGNQPRSLSPLERAARNSVEPATG